MKFKTSKRIPWESFYLSFTQGIPYLEGMKKIVSSYMSSLFLVAGGVVVDLMFKSFTTGPSSLTTL
jgi:hypothetical protein